MNKIKKATGKLLSLILAVAMCVSLVPAGSVTALAATADTPGNAADTFSFRGRALYTKNKKMRRRNAYPVTMHTQSL